jgi:hypothetical protein
LLKFAARFYFVGIRIGILDERGGNADFAEQFAFGAVGDFRRYFADGRNEGTQRFFVRVIGGRSRGAFQQGSQFAHLAMRLRKQVRYLGFQSAGIDDLPQRCVGRERQQVAGNVEGAGSQGALVGVRLHVAGARSDAGEIFKGRPRDFFVGGEEGVDGVAIQGARGGVLETRSMVSTLFEILVAGGPLLAVPALLVRDHDGGEDGKALDGESNVGEVGDRAVAVLEIKCV